MAVLIVMEVGGYIFFGQVRRENTVGEVVELKQRWTDTYLS